MKKYILFVLTLSFILTLGMGCAFGDLNANTATSESTDSKPDIPATTTVEEAVFILPEKLNKGEKWHDLKIDLPQLGLKNQSLYYMSRGGLGAKNSSSQHPLYYNEIAVYIFADTNGTLSGNFYMAVDLGEKIITHYLGNFIFALPAGSLYLADVDGDGDDEIILNMEASGNGVTITHVYKIVDEQIVLLADINDVDFGFTVEFSEDYRITILNKFIDYSYSQNILSIFNTSFFDENGKGPGNGFIFPKPIENVEIFTTKDNGEVNMMCERYFDVEGYYIKGKTTLRYNQQTKAFEVIAGEFASFIKN